MCDLLVPSESTEQKKEKNPSLVPEMAASKPDSPEGMLMLIDNSLQVL